MLRWGQTGDQHVTDRQIFPQSVSEPVLPASTTSRISAKLRL
ncbi:hypothetical protein [uncultured Desulfovibrio sp.]|nr:hypothetical protein [uncultured Desulfovibrio sp.]